MKVVFFVRCPGFSRTAHAILLPPTSPQGHGRGGSERPPASRCSESGVGSPRLWGRASLGWGKPLPSSPPPHPLGVPQCAHFMCDLLVLDDFLIGSHCQEEAWGLRWQGKEAKQAKGPFFSLVCRNNSWTISVVWTPGSSMSKEKTVSSRIFPDPLVLRFLPSSASRSSGRKMPLHIDTWIVPCNLSGYKHCITCSCFRPKWRCYVILLFLLVWRGQREVPNIFLDLDAGEHP